MQALYLYSDTRWYLFFRIWENEIVTFGWNLLLAKFGSENVERRLSPYNLPLSKGTSYSQWRFFPGFAVPSEFPFIAGSCMKSLFTGNDSSIWSSDTAVSSAPVIYSFMSFFVVKSVYLFYFIANVFNFQIDRLEPSFTDSVFRFRFRIPCFSAADFRRLSNGWGREEVGILRDARFFFFGYVRWKSFFFSLLGHIFFRGRIRRNIFFLFRISWGIFFLLLPHPPPSLFYWSTVDYNIAECFQANLFLNPKSDHFKLWLHESSK